jgi:predicted MFS family arabinose efflux permease
MAAASAQAKAVLPALALALGNFVVGMGVFVVIGIITPISEGLNVFPRPMPASCSRAMRSPMRCSRPSARHSRQPAAAHRAGGALAMFCVGSLLSAMSWSILMLTASPAGGFGAALLYAAVSKSRGGGDHA